MYSRWFREFGDKNKDVRVNYQSTGSGAGIKAFIEGQTDFGASDAAMTDDEIKQAKDNVILLPMTAGNIVLAYNLDGVTDLKLSREVYSGHLPGHGQRWDDPKIVASNPGVKLPKLDISVVHRSDGSGTTFVFTQHLAAINEKWKSGPGVEQIGGVAGRRRRRGQERRRCRADPPDARRDRLHRVRLRRVDRTADGCSSRTRPANHVSAVAREAPPLRWPQSSYPLTCALG